MSIIMQFTRYDPGMDRIA